MLKKADIDRVLIQAEYQSGDRYTIASALRVDPRLGVMILHRRDNDSTARDLERLYSGVDNAAKRIVRVPVPPKENNPRNLRKYQGKDLALVAVEQHYTNATQPAFIDHLTSRNDAARRRQNFVFDQLGLIEDGIRFERVSGGTYRIGDVFGAAPPDAKDHPRKRLQEFWSLDRELPVRLWLNRKGFSKNKRYVFLFAKTGSRTAEKAHHFTSILTWRLLADEIARSTDMIPVAVGDDIGLRTTPSLVLFWEEQGWKDAFDGKPTRRDQLGLWAYFATNYHGCSIIGMRSGMIEVPALLGIRTRYIEERDNRQAERMMHWIGKVDTWSRQVVERPPGIAQQKYWAGYRHTREPSAAEAHTLGQVVTGFPKAGLDKKQPGALDERAVRSKIKSLFRTGDLVSATGIDPQQFMIHKGEFDEIMNWLKQAPRGNAQPDPITPRQDEAMGRAAEETIKDVRARVAQRDWTKFLT